MKTRVFVKKAQNFRQFEPYDFVQISLAYGTHIFKGMYGETLDFQCQHLISNSSTEEL